MLPVVATFRRTADRILLYTVVLVAVSVVFASVGHMGALYLVAALGLGAVFVVFALRLRREESSHAAMALFRYSITYLTLLFVAMASDVLLRVH